MKAVTKTLFSLPVMQIENNWKTNKVIPHSLHNLCSRICSFPPSIPNYFIKNFTREGDVVFDAWSGKGTVPFEALRNNRIGIGNDKSPEAFVLTHAKVKPIKIESLQKYILKLKRSMGRVRLSDNLTDLDKNASIYYSNKTFEQILKLREILFHKNSRKAIFVKAIILGLLHGNTSNALSLRCSHSYSMSPNYVRRYAKAHHLRRPSRNVLQCILNKGEALLIDSPPKMDGFALKNDSTHIKLESESADMILTSPPYFDVQTYAWANWLRLWFLGYDYRKIKKILAESGSVLKYQDFMSKSISELYRVLKPSGRCFLVVGDVKIYFHGGYKKIKTADFLLPLCQDAGFELEKIVEDSIPAYRRVMTYIPENDGIKTERILYLTK